MSRNQTGEALAAEAKALREVGQALVALEAMGLAQLRERYQALFGETARSKNLPYLRKKLAFRIQERVEGGLSPFARQRLAELAPEVLPTKPGRQVRRVPTPTPAPQFKARDPRLPEVGTALVREHGGFDHEVEVLEDGFRYRGRTYRSLSAIAREITGTAWNGFLFFGLKAGKVSHGR